MTIIEREIERRELLIIEKATKEAQAAEMQREAERLIAESASIDTNALQAEIDELKEYLPKPDEADVPCVDDNTYV